jgi:preprotein translocase subunit SecG
MSTLITILHIIVCLFLMLTVLLQSGKGGGMGGAFGGGNAATVFGGSGASTFLRRLTAGAGTVFMLTSMVLAFLASRNQSDSLERFGEQQQKLAAEKQAAREKSTFSPGASGGSGSAASEMTPMTPGEGGEKGSAGEINPTGQPNGGPTGSGATPAEIPTPAKPGELPGPSTPSSMGVAPDKNAKPGDAKPADTTKPADATKPADTTKPADATKPADPTKPADAPKP